VLLVARAPSASTTPLPARGSVAADGARAPLRLPHRHWSHQHQRGQEEPEAGGFQTGGPLARLRGAGKQRNK
jgi:hypothetical protein